MVSDIESKSNVKVLWNSEVKEIKGDKDTKTEAEALRFQPRDPGLDFDALEIRDEENIPAVLPFIIRKDLPFVTFSDAHYPVDIGRKRTFLDLPEPSFEELRKALTDFITAHTPTVAGSEEIDTQPTLGFQRVIQRANQEKRIERRTVRRV